MCFFVGCRASSVCSSICGLAWCSLSSMYCCNDWSCVCSSGVNCFVMSTRARSTALVRKMSKKNTVLKCVGGVCVMTNAVGRMSCCFWLRKRMESSEKRTGERIVLGVVLSRSILMHSPPFFSLHCDR